MESAACERGSASTYSRQRSTPCRGLCPPASTPPGDGQSTGDAVSSHQNPRAPRTAHHRAPRPHPVVGNPRRASQWPTGGGHPPTTAANTRAAGGDVRPHTARTNEHGQREPPGRTTLTTARLRHCHHAVSAQPSRPAQGHTPPDSRKPCALGGMPCCGRLLRRARRMSGSAAMMPRPQRNCEGPVKSTFQPPAPPFLLH